MATKDLYSEVAPLRSSTNRYYAQCQARFYITYNETAEAVTVESMTLEYYILKTTASGNQSDPDTHADGNLLYGGSDFSFSFDGTRHRNIYDIAYYGDPRNKRSHTLSIGNTYTKQHSETAIDVLIYPRWVAYANGYDITSGYDPKYTDLTRAYIPWAIEGGRQVATSFVIPPKDSYAVTYNGNGSGTTNIPPAQTKWYGESLNLSNVSPSRTGYAFWHWNTAADNSGTTYSRGAAYTHDTALALYAIWNPYIYYHRNDGSGYVTSQLKTYGQSATLASALSRQGYEFTGWNTAADGTGTSYTAGGTYTGNSMLTLYAQWKKIPNPPTVSSMLVTRADQSGAIQDDGTYMKLTAEWSVDNVNTSGNTGVVTGAYKPSTSSSWTSFSITLGASGASGTATALVGGLSTDVQYDVRVVVTDRDGRVTTRLDILTRAKFVWDIKVGGEAMGIGSAAPQNGLEVGWESQFDQLVKMLEDLEVSGDLSVDGAIDAPQFDMSSASADMVTVSSGWMVSSQSGRSVGHVRMVTVAFRPTAAVEANSQKTLGTLSSDWRPLLTQGFSDTQGIGTVSSGGSISYRNLVALSTSSTVYVGLTFLK